MLVTEVKHWKSLSGPRLLRGVGNIPSSHCDDRSMMAAVRGWLPECEELTFSMAILPGI